MAKGKRIDKLSVYKIMLKMFECDNLTETSKELKIPITTVSTIYKRNKDKKEFVSLRKKQERNFVEKADSIINKATDLLERRLNVALENQNELEELIDAIYDATDEEGNKLKYKEREDLIKKITRLQLNNLPELTTAIGTLYDKRALSLGDPTVNNNVTINIELTDDE
jgi:transcriptional regulator